MCSTMAFFNKKLLTGQGCMINHWCPSAVLQRKKHLIHGYCNSVELANMTVSRWSQPPGALQPEHFQMKSFWLTTTSQNVQVHFPKAEHCSGMELHIAECRALISIRKYQSVLTSVQSPILYSIPSVSPSREKMHQILMLVCALINSGEAPSMDQCVGESNSTVASSIRGSQRFMEICLRLLKNQGLHNGIADGEDKATASSAKKRIWGSQGHWT